MHQNSGLLSFFLKQHDLFHHRCDNFDDPYLRCQSKHLRKYYHRHINISWNFNTCSWLCSSDKKRRQYLYNCDILSWSCNYWDNLHVLAEFLRLFSRICNPAYSALVQCYCKMHQNSGLLSFFVKQHDLLHYRRNNFYDPSMRCCSIYLRKYCHSYIDINWSLRTRSWVRSSYKKWRQHF